MKTFLHSIFLVSSIIFSTNTNAMCESSTASLKQVEVKFTNNESKSLVGDSCKSAIANRFYCSSVTMGDFGGVRIGCFDNKKRSKWLISVSYNGGLEKIFRGSIYKIRPDHESIYGENCRATENVWVCKKWIKLKDVSLRVDNEHFIDIDATEYFDNSFKIN